MNEPTHLDLFSGIGGFSLAAESVGFKTIGFSEIDPYASAVLKKHWPEVHNYGDVRNVTGNTVRDVTLITAGFPCQPFSVAGKKLGDSDERHLWPELVRILSELRPRYALFENVPGLLSISGGRIFNGILSDLCKIGYDCIWNLVPACAVGANHQRDRVWIIAYAGRQPERIESRGFSYKSKNSSEKNLGTETRNGLTNLCKNDPHAQGKRLQGSLETDGSQGQKSHDQLLYGRGREWSKHWAEAATELCGMAHGVSNRIHRLKALGNSIVPQVAQIFLKEIYKELTQ
jgi:DNA (cytosine-5)-methyltransferase 1